MPAPIYLDYAATTPVDQRVIERMVAHMSVDADFGNPASRSTLMAGRRKNPSRLRGFRWLKPLMLILARSFGLLEPPSLTT